ncbi:SusC/RagA family TonB-linked outer membrane protein [Sphingobacterium rhinopitheci]|uniref:SusC/RagA family TonB-linked outer membrane protein n=1 Tax=Sphingobacterium rhinopitheci TaxID=2781960 RepID=UPI001F5174CB|nr:SusC/RagA family TonB-linked outer membrane protein [Sphingobacterium rhinopitheci]MCI0922668.1 SusC/RagA family TonB-linked outer membrane protein [Sphingobacterium rhinopitheci]
MRYFFIFLLCFNYQVFANQNGNKITIVKKNINLETILKNIQAQTDLHIIWQPDLLDRETVYDVNFKNATFDEVFHQLNLDKQHSFTVRNNTIVLKPKEKIQNVQNQLIIGTVKDNNTHKPISGVSVTVEKAGSIYAASTDNKGNFSIKVGSSGLYQLTFSYIGYLRVKKEVDISADKSANIEVFMDEKAVAFEDVVVTGYQTINKREQTAAITSLKMDDIMMPGVSSLNQMLEGRVPELMVMNNSGEVGATARLRVRGTSTLLGNREPLWVLDGWPMTDPVNVSSEDLNNPDYINIIGNAIAGINPQDIDRIDVLKDAAATALYGTRAANGVIVVTTKKGTVGKTRVSYNHSSKVTRRPRYTDRAINLMNSQERVEFGRNLSNLHYRFPTNMANVGYEGAINRYYTGDIDYDTFLQQVKHFETVNTDWFDILTQDAYSSFHTVDVSGGTKEVRYYGSLGYDKDNGVIKNSFSDRYSMRMNFDGNITSKLKMNLRLNGNVQKRNNHIRENNPIDYAYNTTRALPVYNEDGSLYYYNNTPVSTGRTQDRFSYNILNELENSSDTYNGSGMNANLDLRYTFSPEFDLSMGGTYTRNNTTQQLWWGDRTNYVAGLRNSEYGVLPPKGELGRSSLPYGGSIKNTNTVSDNFGFRLQSDFRKSFGSEKQHLITSTAGFEVHSTSSNSYADEARGYIKERGNQFINGVSDIDDFPLYLEWLNQNHRAIGANLSNVVSGYLTGSYSYSNHFTVSMNGRTDYSNNFGSRSNEKFLPVWAVSGMWNPKFTFFNDSDLISDLRIRSSFGKQGNMLPDQSPNLIMKFDPFDPHYNENISTVARFPNPNLRWEQTSSFNSSMDVSLLSNRLNLSATYYNKQTKDAFTSVKVSSVNGILEYVMNNGGIRNYGYSLTIGAKPIVTDDFTWNFFTMYSANKNSVRVGSLENFEYSNYLNGTALVDGESVGTFYSYQFLGLNPSNGLPMFEDFVDRKHMLEGKSLEETVKMTMVNSGVREPRFNGSFSNSFSYKSFSLSMNMTYSLGSMVRLFAMYAPVSGGIKAETNVRKEFVDRWQLPGDELVTYIPAIISPSNPLFSQYSNHYSTSLNSKVPVFASSIWDMYDNGNQRVVSGDFLKMTSMSMRYTLKPAQLKRTPFSAASISFNTQNLFTISAKELKGQDPSQAGFANASLSIRPAYTLQFNVSF